MMEFSYLDTANYSFIDNINDINNINNNNNNYNENNNNIIEYNEEELNPIKIINSYNNLQKLLNKCKDEFEKLQEQKTKFYNYQSKLLLEHAEIVNICLNTFNIKNNTNDNTNDNINNNTNDKTNDKTNDNINDNTNDNTNDKTNDNINDNEIKITKTTEDFINYEKNMKLIYNRWVFDYYNPKIIKINNDINDLELKICNYRKLFILTINSITNTTEIINKKLCPICFNNEVDMCASPCGHTCCNECVKSYRDTNLNNIRKCVSCRNVINNYIKLYFLV